MIRDFIQTASELPPDRARALLCTALKAQNSGTPADPRIKMVPLDELVSGIERGAAARAFERDMQPVCKAVVEALQAGDKHTLIGLRGMLPHLLEEVNESPELADVLTRQLGRELLAGLNGEEAAER